MATCRLPARGIGPADRVRGRRLQPDIERKRRYIERHWAAKGVPLDRVARALELLIATGNPFLDLCMMKGRFPSRKAQFCTQELKRFPLDRWMLDRMGEGLTLESWRHPPRRIAEPQGRAGRGTRGRRLDDPPADSGLDGPAGR